MQSTLQTVAPAASPAQEDEAFRARFVAAGLIAEGRRAAACGLDSEPYSALAENYLDKAAAAYTQEVHQ